MPVPTWRSPATRVDRDASSVTLFSDPGREDRRQVVIVPFGKPLPLPEPFGSGLETADFL